MHRLDQLQLLGQVNGLPLQVPVYVKFNTGMNRLGFRPDALGALREELAKNRAVSEVTLMTHFADADGARGIDWQLQQFRAMAGEWRGRCPGQPAAILRHPQAGRDWTRPGIMLYGGSPFADESAESLGLRPVMTLSSEIIGVQQIVRARALATAVPSLPNARPASGSSPAVMPTATHATRRRGHRSWSTAQDADARPGVDGHAGRGPDGPARGRGRLAGDTVGKACLLTGGGCRRHHQLRAVLRAGPPGAGRSCLKYQ